MRLARKLHLFFGVFFAPSIIFFALSGFFQAFGWHEEHDGKQPMAWVATISDIHKDQRLPATRPQPDAAQPAPSAVTTPQPEAASTAASPSATAPASPAQAAPGKARGPAGPRRNKKSFPFQVFMGFMAVGLIGSSLVGIWMGFQVNRNTALVLGLLIAGTIIPIVALYAGM